MQIEEMSNEKEWDTFVCSSNTGTFYHSIKWKEVIEKSFPHHALYLVVKDAGGKVVGVSPGFITESLHARIYDSTPYSDYGGPLIEASHVSKASFAILDFLRNLSSSKGLSYARFRVTGKSLESHLRSQIGYAQSNLGVMEINLRATPSRFIWSNLFSSNRRKKFKQMERKGFQVREVRTRSDLRVFYSLYLNNMMRIGARPYPYNFMENIWDTLFPSHVRIWILEDQKPLAAKLFFRFAKKSFSAFVGLERDQQQVYSHASSPVDYLSWTEIKKAEEEDLWRVSLGSTPSNPDSKYFVQKSSMGCILVPQAIVWTPLCSLGQILIQMRAPSVYIWKAVRTSLPSPLARILEGKLARL
jgi:hypothetical protein